MAVSIHLSVFATVNFLSYYPTSSSAKFTDRVSVLMISVFFEVVPVVTREGADRAIQLVADTCSDSVTVLVAGTMTELFELMLLLEARKGGFSRDESVRSLDCANTFTSAPSSG